VNEPLLEVDNLRITFGQTTATHVFEGMRAVMMDAPAFRGLLAAAFDLSIPWLAAAASLFAATLRSVRERGRLVKLATQ